MSDPSTPSRSRSRRRALLIMVPGLVAFAAIVAGFAFSASYHHSWRDYEPGRAPQVAHFAAFTIAVIAGAWMVWRRPSNRCGPVAMMLGLVFGLWNLTFFVAANGTWWRVGTTLMVASLRPLLWWLVLAFPIGRLDRVSRRLFAVILVGESIAIAINLLWKGEDSQYPQVLGRLHGSAFTWLAVSAWWDVGALFAAAAVLVIVQRRRLRFRTLGDRVGVTAWWAAVVATGADFVLFGQGPVRELEFHNDGLTPFGSIIQVVDFARWGIAVLLLALAARRAWPREETTPDSIEIDEAGIDDSLRSALARALGDPRADVAVRDAGSGWLDLSGRARAQPGGSRTATIVTHDGQPVAALEYDDALAVHPAVVDAAVAALALQLESARQLALARNREIELRRLGRDVLDAEDTARRQLERDLHDGAQQALIGVGLQSALLARANGGSHTEVVEVADAIDEVAASLLTIATGRPPALLVERGLDGALGALVLTAGLPVTVDIDRCDDLADGMQRAVWFTAAEAVTNALKHARASHLRMTLRRSTTEVILTVADDGRGGIDEAPASLSRRVADAGGHLLVDSNGTGTAITATFPLRVAVTA